jgi:hypothetical protein
MTIKPKKKNLRMTAMLFLHAAKIILTKVTCFSKTYYRIPFQDTKLIYANISPISGAEPVQSVQRWATGLISEVRFLAEVIFLFSTAYRPPLRPTQSPIQ